MMPKGGIKFTMKDLLNYLEKANKFPQYMDKPIALYQQDYNAEPLYLEYVAENSESLMMIFSPEKNFK